MLLFPPPFPVFILTSKFCNNNCQNVEVAAHTRQTDTVHNTHVECILLIIRTILEYGNAAWVPALKREQQQIENVQRRATKMVTELQNLEYTDRLRMMKLPSMYYRRARGDMIEVYKYLHGQYNVEEVPLLLDEIRMTRGHSRRLKSLTGEFVSSKIIAFGYATQRATFVFASVVNAAQCNASTG